MKRRILHALAWDLRLQVRSGTLWAALALAILAMAIPRFPYLAQRRDLFDWALPLLYLLLAVFLPLCLQIRKERTEGVLAWINATPQRPHEYLAAKIAAWAPVSLAGVAALALASHGLALRPLPLLAGALLAEILLVMAAFIAMAGPRTAAGALGAACLAVLVLVLPFLPFGSVFALLVHPLLTVVALFLQAFDPSQPAQTWILALGLGAALPWLGAGLLLCKRAYGLARSAA